MNNVPYRCVKCMKEGACGYNGQLVFGDGTAPVCDHDSTPGKPCHGKPVTMIPVRQDQFEKGEYTGPLEFASDEPGLRFRFPS